MKKIYYLIFITGALLFSVASCKIDNFPGPNAQVHGAMRDTIGGGFVETDLNTGSQIGVYELGQYAANPIRKAWYIMQDGEYRNDLVFANDYKFDFTSCNFFPITYLNTVKPGDNPIDFVVTPFIRVKNLSITYDAVANKINASFTLEGGRPSVKVASVTLYSWSDMYVGQYVKKVITTGTGVPTLTLSGAAQTINPATVYNLSIDLAANANTTMNGFAVHRDYYFRVGAMAIQAGVGTIRANYAPYKMIPL
jgi:hypothetical protein